MTPKQQQEHSIDQGTVQHVKEELIATPRDASEYLSWSKEQAQSHTTDKNLEHFAYYRLGLLAQAEEDFQLSLQMFGKIKSAQTSINKTQLALSQAESLYKVNMNEQALEVLIQEGLEQNWRLHFLKAKCYDR